MVFRGSGLHAHEDTGFGGWGLGVWDLLGASSHELSPKRPGTRTSDSNYGNRSSTRLR